MAEGKPEVIFGFSEAVSGSIHSEHAYALGKMLDHSGWHGQLVRGITPSDVDMLFDNNGMIIVCELSSWARDWHELKRGQRWVYEAFIKDRPFFAVLCKHSVKPQTGRQINTQSDIECFHVMAWDHGPVYSGIVEGNEAWRRLVRYWCNRSDGPLILRRKLLGADAARMLDRQRHSNVVPISTAERKGAP